MKGAAVMTHKEAAAVIRGAVKAAGFHAKVRVAPGGGAVQVITPSYDARFTGDEIAAFCSAAISLGMTFVRQLPISIDHERQLIGRHQWEFYL